MTSAWTDAEAIAAGLYEPGPVGSNDPSFQLGSTLINNANVGAPVVGASGTGGVPQVTPNVVSTVAAPSLGPANSAQPVTGGAAGGGSPLQVTVSKTCDQYGNCTDPASSGITGNATSPAPVTSTDSTSAPVSGAGTGAGGTSWTWNGLDLTRVIVVVLGIVFIIAGLHLFGNSTR